MNPKDYPNLACNGMRLSALTEDHVAEDVVLSPDLTHQLTDGDCLFRGYDNKSEALDMSI